MLLDHVRCLNVGWSGNQRSRLGIPTLTLSWDTRRWTGRVPFTRDISFVVHRNACPSSGLHSSFLSYLFYLQLCPCAFLPWCVGSKPPCQEPAVGNKSMFSICLQIQWSEHRSCHSSIYWTALTLPAFLAVIWFGFFLLKLLPDACLIFIPFNIFFRFSVRHKAFACVLCLLPSCIFCICHSLKLFDIVHAPVVAGKNAIWSVQFSHSSFFNVALLVIVHPDVKNWIKYARFEEKHSYFAHARKVYERAVEFFGEEHMDEHLYVAFAKFEENQKEVRPW